MKKQKGQNDVDPLSVLPNKDPCGSCNEHRTEYIDRQDMAYTDVRPGTHSY